MPATSPNLDTHFNHPYPASFDNWARGGRCPYDAVSLLRSANFQEKRKIWSPGVSKSALELMIMLIKEKCADSHWH